MNAIAARFFPGLAATAFFLLVPFFTAASEKPNIIFILTDNHGAWTMGCYGNPDIQTPHVDRMAKEGVRFTNAFCNNAVCSPTRATYLTGLNCSQHGVHNFLGGGRLQTGPEPRNTLEDFTSLPEVLKSNGYRCGLVGKWHLGNNMEPNEGLDDYWITMPHGGTATFHGAKVIHEGKLYEEPTYLTEFWTQHALEFIDQEAENEEQPFFLYLAYNGPYGLSRYQLKSSGNRWADFYKDKELPSFPRGVIHPWEYNNREYFGNPVSIRRYAEELSAIDDGVGAIMKKLESHGLTDDTLIVFAADQGWAGGQHGLWGMGDHTRPVNAREHSMRIPMVFYHPGSIKAGQEPDIFVSNYDFMPSVLGYLGLGDQMPKEPAPPGRDFSLLLKGEGAKMPAWDDIVFYEYETLRCLRTPEWKYVERFGDGHDELYRIGEDPDERTNLAGLPEHAAIQADLQKRLDRFFDEHSTGEYNLWKGGGSQPRLLVWGEEAQQRQKERAKRMGGIAPTVIDPDFNPPPFELPDGLVAEVAAAPPLVEHPIMAAFDDRGRLFVSDNAGLNLKKEELAEQLPNSVRMLEDSNGDGLFDKSTVFADRMTFPQGALWLNDSLYVMSPPSLWRLTDHDDDGVADEREELVTGLDYTGNAADVHGPFLHPNGRIYWCHGRKGHEVFDPGTGDLVSKNKGARIWSCQPNGSDVQVFAGGGMDNPVEVDFTETGEILGTVNLFYGRPRGDVIVHWLHGGAYPRHDQEAVVAEFTRTGPLLPEVHNFGHVAVSGMMRYRTGHLNPEWKDNIIVTHFNTQKITRTALDPDGSTFRSAATEEILKIGSPDTHITDVLEDPNGDLLVLDTGGWFRIGCPTSQIAKPDIKGAIYRIRKAGLRDRTVDAFGLSVNWEDDPIEKIASLLDDESFAIRGRAVTELAVRGEPALPELGRILGDTEATPMARRNAVWALSRMSFSDSPDLIATALDDSDPSVRHAACNALAATRSWSAAAANNPDEARIEIERNAGIASRLRKLAVRDEPAIQRAAASALGRMADPNAVTGLLDIAGRTESDRQLQHAAIHGLIEIGDAGTVKSGLDSENPRVQAAALLALDQIEDESTGEGSLDTLTLLPRIDAEDELLLQTALDIAGRHPDWDAAIANRFHDWLDEGELGDRRGKVFIQLAPRFLGTPPMQTLVGQYLNAKNSEAVSAGFSAIAAADSSTFHESWTVPFRAALGGSDEALQKQALDALARAKSPAFDEALGELANDESKPALLRVRALQATAKPNSALGQSAFDLLKSLISPETSPLQRLDAARMLGSSRLSTAQLAELAGLTAHAGPMDLPPLLKAFERTRDAEVGKALARALPESKGIGNVNPAELKRMFTKFPPEIYPAIEPTVDKLLARKEQQAARLAELEPELTRGDAERGRKAYLEGKGACITCHKIGEIGRAVGPDLTTIGRIRTRRDLLESMLYPSESIARDFESYSVTLQDDTAHFGLIQRETADTVYVTNVAGEEIPLQRSAISKIDPVPLSIMPQGLDQALTKQELLDLIAFLKAQQ